MARKVEVLFWDVGEVHGLLRVRARERGRKFAGAKKFSPRNTLKGAKSERRARE
jgi:hypothetical protein